MGKDIDIDKIADLFGGLADVDDNDIADYIVLQDENGDDVNFEVLDVMEYVGGTYAFLLPEEEEDAELVILEVVEEDGVEKYMTPQDEKTCAMLFEMFKTKYAEEFDFE